MKNVAYVHSGLSSFVKKDLDILQTSYQVHIHFFSLKSKKGLILSFVKQFFFLFRQLFLSKVWIVQFAGYQSFLPVLIGKIFRKKVVLVLGGTDCVSFPSIQYGCFYNKQLRPFTAYSIKKASLLLPVDQTLVEYDYNYQTNDFPKQGFQYHVKGVTTPYQVIYNGFDELKWSVLPKESGSFVTVAADLSTRFGPQLKGIDLILEIASSFPESKFYVVGGKGLTVQLPNNVFLVDKIENHKLPEFIGTKEFYLQLSMSEGFPNALSEAMLCGCIPIVSNVGAMPMIVEDSGYVLQRKDSKELIRIIKSALLSEKKETQSKSAREIIATKYYLKRREHEFLSAIENLF